MAGEGSSGLTVACHIILKRLRNLITEIDNHLISTFSCNHNSIVLKIYILYIQSDTFGYTDSGS